MDSFETPYEDGAPAEYIHCIACNKSIRGQTLYKIHRTLARHIKNEDDLVAKGIAVRDHIVPEFKDIVQYLKYLALDEPIIGLKYLEEVPRLDQTDNTKGPNYHCMLCDNDGNMTFMVNHIIGRKHRQKYLEMKREDLVTWEKNSTQPGKVIRAKAEVVERQDGQGAPRVGLKEPPRLGLKEPPRAMRKFKNIGKLNISKAPPRQEYHSDQNARHKMPPMDFHGELSHREGPPLDDSYAPHFHQDDPYMMADPRREAHPWEGPPRREPMEEEVRRADYMDINRDMEMDIHRREFMEDDYHRKCQEDYGGDMHRGFRETGDVPRPGYREEMPPGPAYPEEGYPQEPPPHRRPYPENDPLKQFYSEEVKRGRVRSAEAAEPRRRPYPIDDPRGPAYPEGDPHSYPQEHPEQGYPGEPPRERAYPEEEPRRIIDYSHGIGPGPVDERARQRAAPTDPYSADARRGRYCEDETQRRAYPEDEPLGPGYPEAEPHRRSMDRDPNRHGNANGAGRQGAGDPDAKRKNLYNKDHLLEIVKAFRQERRGPHQEEPEGSPGPRFRGPPPSHRPPGGARAISEIPEPFKRFLERSESEEDHGKRKRKSRFSDATKEEMEVVQEMLTDEYRSPHSHGPPRPNHGPRRPEVPGPPRPGPYAQSQGPYQAESYPRQAESYPRGGSTSLPAKSSNSGNALDVLNNIEIENVEEADFLKNKLCSLLKEFQAKKSEKSVQKSQGPPVISKDYDHLSQDAQESPRGQYERGFREAPEDRRFENQPRRPQKLYPQEDHRGRGWEEPQQQEEEERFKEYSPPPFHPELRASNRRRYEEVFGQAGQFPPPHARPAEEPLYPERFQEPMHPERFQEPMHPERFQEPMHPRGFPPEEVHDPYLPPPPFRRDQGFRMHGAPQHSSSLDKITSTLLELVARK